IKLDDELGCIPMSNSVIQDTMISGVIQLGARNYSIKPSTGYAFKRMFYHAEEIATSLAEGKSPTTTNRSHREAFNGRFAFYDSLLLNILARAPHHGKRIFEALFKHNKIERILTFLDERSAISAEVAIFSRLPLAPFLRSLWRKAKHHPSFVPSILLILCAVLALLPLNTSVMRTLASVVFLIGLVTVGIPHGALDHLLETKQLDTGKLPGFILKYLTIGLIMAILWSIAPTLSLLFFLLYSSWHFGQADGKQWGMSAPLSLLWGASVLAFILGTHVQETHSILETIGAFTVHLTIPWWAFLPWVLIFAFKRNSAGVLTAIWLIMSSQIPLMFAFGLYFIGQHSLTGWKHIQRHLGMTHQQLWLHALPFHAGAWLILGLFIWVQGTMKLESPYFGWGNFFIFLACISLPHAIAMQQVYREKTVD
ncbi:MAG: beta-carotene 15,15'-dioxygenase, Brp/Blh family, partial [Flavobacteriales bacterium]